MTAPTERVVNLLPIPNTIGCTAHPAGEELCGRQETVQLSPQVGRRCPDHPVLLPGPLDRGLLADMADLGRFDAVFAYLRAWLARETAERFGAALARVEAA